MQLKNVKILNELLVKHGQETNTPSKKQVWGIKGLDRRFGDYAGTPAQINVLIKNLKHNPINSTTVGNYFKGLIPPVEAFERNKKTPSQGGMSVVPGGMSKIPQMSVLPEDELTKLRTNAKTGITPDPNQYSSPIFPKNKPLQPAPQTATGTMATASKGMSTQQQFILSNYGDKVYQQTFGTAPPTPEPTTTSTPTPEPTPTPETKAADVLPPTPTATDIMTEAFDSTKFKLEAEAIGLDVAEAEQESEVKKQQLQQQFEQDKSQLESLLASRGLFFSGLRTEQTNALISNLASSELGVDRKLANTLLRTNLDLKNAIFDSIADVVQEAENGRKEAIAQLNKAGLAVVNGELVPTMEAQKHALSLEKEVRIEENEAARFDLQQAQFQFSQARTQVQLEQGQQRIDIAQRRLQLSAAIAEGKTFNIITQSTQNKLAAAGVPNTYAMWMQTNLNQGATYAQLETDLINKYEKKPEEAKKMVEDFKTVMARSAEDEFAAMFMALLNSSAEQQEEK